MWSMIKWAVGAKRKKRLSRSRVGDDGWIPERLWWKSPSLQMNLSAQFCHYLPYHSFIAALRKEKHWMNSQGAKEAPT